MPKKRQQRSKKKSTGARTSAGSDAAGMWEQEQEMKQSVKQTGDTWTAEVVLNILFQASLIFLPIYYYRELGRDVASFCLVLGAMLLLVLHAFFRGSPAVALAWFAYVIEQWNIKKEDRKRHEQEAAEREAAAKERGAEQAAQRRRQWGQEYREYCAEKERSASQRHHSSPQQQRRCKQHVFKAVVDGYIYSFTLPDGVHPDQLMEAIHRGKLLFNIEKFDYGEADFAAIVKKELNLVLQRDFVFRMYQQDRQRAEEWARQHQQDQWRQQQQRSQQQEQQHGQWRPQPWQLSQDQQKLLVEAVAPAPAVEVMSMRMLREFLQEVGVQVPWAEPDQLLQLAKAATKLYEARRLLKCMRIAETWPSLKLHAALAVFRITCTGPGQTAAAVAKQAQPGLKGTKNKIALLVHPDKVPADLQEHAKVFLEAFKVLANAYELLLGQAAAGA